MVALAPAQLARKAVVAVTSYAQIDRQPTLFLTFSEPVLNGRIPRGEVTIVAGEGGAGKGQIAVWMAVDVAMQGEHAILVTPEDNLEATVRPRLEATVRALAPGCDGAYVTDVLSRVHDLTYTRSGAPFELSADGRHEGSVGQLRELVDNPTLDTGHPDPDYAGPPAALVMIDPLLACLAYGTIATNLGARRVLGPLARLTGETGCGLVLTHHTVESGKVAGSKGLVDAARLVYRAKRDRENPGIRVLQIDKSNILAECDPVRYQIAGDGADTFVRWLDRDELAARRTAWRERPDRDQDKLLRVLRANGGVMRGEDLAAAAGVAYDSARMALSRMKAGGLVDSPRRGLFIAAECAAAPAPWFARSAGWADAPI